MAKKIRPVSSENIEKLDQAIEENQIDNISKTSDKTIDDESEHIVLEQNRALIEENSALKDQLNNYINELNELKTTRDKDDYAKKYNECLEKIAELTFENAKLKEQINSMTSCINSMSPTKQPPKFHQPKISNDPYNPYSNNGYFNWN